YLHPGVARVWSPHDAAPGVVRRTDRALARASGSLLTVRLLPAAANLAAGLSVARPSSPSGHLRDDDLVHDGNVHPRFQDPRPELDIAERDADLCPDRDAPQFAPRFTAL